MADRDDEHVRTTADVSILFAISFLVNCSILILFLTFIFNQKSLLCNNLD